MVPTREEKSSEERLENSVALVYVEDMNYWAQSLVILSDQAK